ncbi:hypothetical protein SEUCBS140593_008147 [Sporothrix eucalyptigena]|uniref:Uncharacterized protein n=1 Tax=Sporothrix eucalyptigena TaxID=1812306 RepID=A0ABP0CLY2_9PEZI
MSSFNIDDLFSVRGKIVVVTDGGAGFGKHIPDEFATNGSKVYITGHHGEIIEKTAAEINEKFAGSGGQVIPIQGDVGSKPGAEALIKQISEKESYHVWINNAGVQRNINYPSWDHNNRMLLS